MNEWNIQSRAHACQSCGSPFADQQRYHTLLFDERQHYRRLDVCGGCWQSQFSQGASDRKGFVSCWHGLYEAPPAAPPDPIRKENAESLLRKLLEQAEPQHAAAAYILAVMLERKRLLKVKEQLLRDGQRTFVYEQPGTGDLFSIADPNLQLDQLEEVQRDVADLLEHGLNPPAGPSPPPTPQSESLEPGSEALVEAAPAPAATAADETATPKSG